VGVFLFFPFPSDRRSAEPARSVLSRNPSSPFPEAYGLLFRVHPEVLRISLHKPQQRCGGVFSTFSGIGGAGEFMDLSGECERPLRNVAAFI